MVAQTLDKLKKDQPIQAYLLGQEAFAYGGYYLKHQVLLQKQADNLSEPDFLTIEQARTKHLQSLAHIVVSANSDPLVFSTKLSELIAPQVGSNSSKLATVALLRDLENNAKDSDQKSLRQAQTLLQKEVEIKLSKLTKPERLKLVERYINFIHGNPIRQFQAYNQISKSFTSKEMVVLTSALKDKAAQNFKKHLNYLANETIQKQFIGTLFSEFPVDLRLLFYTEIQLNKPKEQQNAIQIQRLKQIKAMLTSQICQNYGQNPEKLAQTRFYTESINQPDVLDLKVAEYLNQSIKNCISKSPQSLKLVNDLQSKINSSFIFEAKQKIPVTDKLPTKTEAAAILKEENIQVSPADAQQVAEEIIEETQDIENSVSKDTSILEKEIENIKEITTAKTITEADEIIEETIVSSEPTQEEIIKKEEEIIEQIEDAAASGETSPLIEELPQEAQQEISHETGVTLASPSPLSSATLAPTANQTIAPTPTPNPTTQPSSTEEPTLIETVVSTVPEPTPTTTTVTTPSF
ncbi:hypothetical protein HY025_04475 [Candidatus Daviesbacteria bacterium]|nr:hypothetical protein [Candidatus Daviesbacteria bacterium]